MTLEPYLKKKIVAEYLGYHPITLDRWADAGCPCFISPSGEKTYKISEVVEWSKTQARNKLNKKEN